MSNYEFQNRYVLPTIEERTSYGYKRLDPYTKLFEERIIFLGQAIDDLVGTRGPPFHRTGIAPDADLTRSRGSGGPDAEAG